MEVDYKTQGGPVLINTDNILRVEKNNKGKCAIALQGHTNYWIRVEESFEKVIEMLHPTSPEVADNFDVLPVLPVDEKRFACFLNLFGEEVILREQGDTERLPEAAEYIGGVLESDILCKAPKYKDGEERLVIAVDVERKKILPDTIRTFKFDLSLSMALTGAGIIESLTGSRFQLLELILP